ncbi:hemagglutinin repeat-containing protein [Neisseria sp. HMSC31F04]|uniref:hemagglutinin repeat-containing protein n=1 Tax=Neisseria sp. HMSC31F04 TaxID=1581075 RepID=UPI001FEDF720|nr:hemagglutinin repeat-containing protein [Neisseria sp. HMSC31F04]
MKAGGDINIRSREGDITVQGSNITAGDTMPTSSRRRCSWVAWLAILSLESPDNVPPIRILLSLLRHSPPSAFRSPPIKISPGRLSTIRWR